MFASACLIKLRLKSCEPGERRDLGRSVVSGTPGDDATGWQRVTNCTTVSSRYRVTQTSASYIDVDAGDESPVQVFLGSLRVGHEHDAILVPLHLVDVFAASEPIVGLQFGSCARLGRRWHALVEQDERLTGCKHIHICRYVHTYIHT